MAKRIPYIFKKKTKIDRMPVISVTDKRKEPSYNRKLTKRSASLGLVHEPKIVFPKAGSIDDY